MKIITDCWRKPIPIRDYDWSAVTDDYEPGHPIGFGATEEKAIQDLKELLPMKKKKSRRRERIIRSLMKEIETYRPINEAYGAVPGDVAETILYILWAEKWSWEEDDEIWKDEEE